MIEEAKRALTSSLTQNLDGIGNLRDRLGDACKTIFVFYQRGREYYEAENEEIQYPSHHHETINDVDKLSKCLTTLRIHFENRTVEDGEKVQDLLGFLCEWEYSGERSQSRLSISREQIYY